MPWPMLIGTHSSWKTTLFVVSTSKSVEQINYDNSWTYYLTRGVLVPVMFPRTVLRILKWKNKFLPLWSFNLAIVLWGEGWLEVTLLA